MYWLRYHESHASSINKPVSACMDVALIETSVTISILRHEKIYFKIARDIKAWNSIWSWEWQGDTDSLICLGDTCVLCFVMNRMVMKRNRNLILELLKRLKELVLSLFGFKWWSFYYFDLFFFVFSILFGC